jgi:flagellin-like hook-associated protein FlgL
MADPNSIVLSAGVQSNLLSLQNTNDLFSQINNRLATGKKINSALDNATNFFLSNAFKTSASTLQGLLDNGITNSLRTIDAANTGITAITALINQIKANLAQSLTTNNTTAVTTGTVSNLTTASSFATTVGKTITVSDGVTTATYTTVGASTTVAQILAAVNNTALETVKASLNGSGQIILEAQGATAITVGGTIAPAELAQFGLVAGVTAAGVLSASRTTSAQQFDALRTQIDQLAADSGYNGVSLLNGGGLKVVFNQTSTSFQTIAGSTDTSTGLGVVASTGNFQTTFDINAALTNATAALTTLQNQASTFASVLAVDQARSDFTKAQINTLNTGANGLVVSDPNADGASLLALQTRQQLGSTALSLATQADRGVLRLFGG